ncbi:MAG TPA: 30S ribosomal protein S3 [Candidatus Paceibacterota bacterium]
MGHKIRPDSFRTGIIRPWQSRWFFRGNYKTLLEEDELIRKIVNEKIEAAGIVAIEIERTAGRTRVNIKAAKPGLIIGRGGKGIEELHEAIKSALVKLKKKGSASKSDKSTDVSLNIEELKRSEVSAQFIAKQIAWDLEKRMPFRRTIKKYIEQMMQNKEVEGAKIRVGGRLDGAEIARDESLSRGKLPLQTIRANIDYGEATAFTTFGTIGIKVWVYKGNIFKKETKKQ